MAVANRLLAITQMCLENPGLKPKRACEMACDMDCLMQPGGTRLMLPGGTHHRRMWDSLRVTGMPLGGEGHYDGDVEHMNPEMQRLAVKANLHPKGIMPHIARYAGFKYLYLKGYVSAEEYKRQMEVRAQGGARAQAGGRGGGGGLPAPRSHLVSSPLVASPRLSLPLPTSRRLSLPLTASRCLSPPLLAAALRPPPPFCPAPGRRPL